MSDIEARLTVLQCDLLEMHYLDLCKRQLDEEDREEERRRKRSRKGKIWTRKWILRRNELGTSTALLRELAEEDPLSYRKFLRMSEENFNQLLAMLNPSLQKADTVMRAALPLKLKLEISLRYLATGDSFETLANMFRVPIGSISLFLPDVLDELKDRLSPFMKVPTTKEEWENVGKKFAKKWQFPRCVGALDGKHIRIQCPAKSGSYFFNYKKFFSIILFALVDAEYNFIYLSVGANGRTNDAAVWSECSLKTGIEDGTLNFPSRHVIAGDDIFPLKPFLLKPYGKTHRKRKEKVFDYRLSRARRIVENAFGILAWRFRIFQRPLNLKPESMDKIIWAACSLHNWLRHLNPANTICLADTENLNTGHVIPGDWRSIPQPFQTVQGLVGSRNYTRAAEKVRNWYAKYFIHEGAVPWQWDRADVSEYSSDEHDAEDPEDYDGSDEGEAD